MQFIAPAWLDAIRFGAIPEDADRRNPEHSIAAAASYLAWLKQRFHEWMKVVAAYNAGPGTLARILSVNTPVSWESRLPQETRAYVARVAGEFKRLTGKAL
jgi:soluble lytic murein transglycosylase-like protein